MTEKLNFLKHFFDSGKYAEPSFSDIEEELKVKREEVRALRRHIRELHKSNKELEEFACIASHDLQEPLRKITMFGERLWLRLENTLDTESKSLLSRILASSFSMKSLLDDLLDFSRTSDASNFSMLDLRTLVDQVVGDLELKIEETQCILSIKGVLPRIEAVSSEMKQLFTNLVMNSIKFRKIGVPPAIEIAVRKLTKDEKKAYHFKPASTFYKIDVTDNGIGFEEEFADRIFQIFQRLHSKAEYPGTGVGLAICKKIVENHNGMIFAHGVPNEGATFTIMLPEKQS